jgi:hypothetical protein
MYFYGNLERGRGDNMAARDYYQKALKLCMDRKSKHMLTASVLYKLGVIKAEAGEIGPAM